MRHILTSLVLLVLLFPSLALGETVKFEDLVEREGLHYKKSSQVPFTGEVTGKEQGKLKNGKKEGPWVEFWSNGQLLSKGTYRDGKQDGLWVSYYENGQLEYKGTHKYLGREGPWVSYYENGQLEYKGTHKNGKRDGPWFEHYKNGQLNYKVTYKDGGREGPWVGYLEDGTVDPKRTGTFKNGKSGSTGESFALPECPGSPKTNLDPLATDTSQWNGATPWHNCEGTFTFERIVDVGEWKDGKLHGQGTRTFYALGNYVGQFKYGNYHGQGIFYNANGTVFEEGIFENGQFKYDKKP